MHSFSACELHRRFVDGEVSARKIAEDFLNRIRQLDPSLGAYLEIFEARVIEQADRLDCKRRGGEPLGLLAGIPIAIKDNINIKGEKTTCASKFLENFIAPFDATVTRRIREEDGIILGKTNLDEFAMGTTCENSAVQITRNPWDSNLVPGGSSGGSAAAVAADMAPIAFGSDTGGSIRLPASFCGISSFKPTYGRISRYGLVAFGSSLDQIGPMAYSCEDLERIMQVVAVPCEKDSTSLSDPAFSPVSFEERYGSGFRVGVPWQFLEGLPNDTRAIFDRALKSLRSIGADIIEVDLSILQYAVSTYYILCTAEASTNLARFDGIRYGVRSDRAETLDEVYDFSREEGFGDEVKRRIMLGTFVLSSGYQDAYYRKAQKVRQLIINRFNDAFLKCDCIAFPTSLSGAFAFGEKKEPLSLYLEDLYTVGANLTGVPVMALPAGFLPDSRPIGFQLFGQQRHDAELLSIGRAFQSVTEYHIQRPKGMNK